MPTYWQDPDAITAADRDACDAPGNAIPTRTAPLANDRFRANWSAAFTGCKLPTADVLRAEVNGRCRCPRPRPTYPLGGSHRPGTIPSRDVPGRTKPPGG
jgi:hypothetical protein